MRHGDARTSLDFEAVKSPPLLPLVPAYPRRRPYAAAAAASLLALPLAIMLAGCGGGQRAEARGGAFDGQILHARHAEVRRVIRATGVIVPTHSAPILAPQLMQNFAQLTVTELAPNGAQVKKGDLLVAFDRTALVVKERAAKAKYLDQAAQVRRQRAQNAAAAAKRAQALAQAEADEAKAALELRKAPILSHIQLAEDRIQYADARAQAASLRRSNPLEAAEAAATLQALALKRDRQRLDWRQAERDSRKLVIRAPIAGMLAYTAPPWTGHLAPGARAWGGMKLLEVFDPRSMRVRAQFSEADFTPLAAGTPASVRLDAYPKLRFRARLADLSPVATGASDTPVRTFSANFAILPCPPGNARCARRAARLLPDLSCAVTVRLPALSGWLAPRAAVRFAHRQSYIWVRRGGKTVRQRVAILGFDADGVLLGGGVNGATRLLTPPGGGR